MYQLVQYVDGFILLICCPFFFFLLLGSFIAIMGYIILDTFLIHISPTGDHLTSFVIRQAYSTEEKKKQQSPLGCNGCYDMNCSIHLLTPWDKEVVVPDYDIRVV